MCYYEFTRNVLENYPSMFGKVFCEFSKCISRWNTYIRRKNKRSDEFSRKNLDEETMLKKLREIRVRDNLPMR